MQNIITTLFSGGLGAHHLIPERSEFAKQLHKKVNKAITAADNHSSYGFLLNSVN